MITIICPTRNRALLCKRMVDSARATANWDINVVLGIAGDVHASEDYDAASIQAIKYSVGELPTIAVSNFLVNSCLNTTPFNKTKLFVMAGDDVIFSTPGWDEALIKAYEALENKIHVFSLLDSRDPEGTPHPIVTREYIDAMGYFMPPIFLHWYGDSWTTEVAKYAGCFTHLKDYLLVHEKPSDKGKPDDTHLRIRAMGWHDRDCYVDQVCRHFLETEKNRLLADVKVQKVINYR